MGLLEVTSANLIWHLRLPFGIGVEVDIPFYGGGQLASTSSWRKYIFTYYSNPDQSQLTPVPSSRLSRPDQDVHCNFCLLNFFVLITVYCKTTHLLTRSNISPPAPLGEFTKMSYCLKLDLLCLISSLRFYGCSGLFPTKYIAAILIGIEL